MPTGNFLQTYFAEPLLRGGFFNPVNTAILSVVLIIAIFLVYKLLKRLGIPIDSRFFIGVIPFVFWAATTRVLRDLSFALARNASEQAGTLSQFTGDIVFNYNLVYDQAVAYLSLFLPASFASVYGWVVAFFPTPGSYLITFVFAFVAFLIGIVIQKFTKIAYWKPMFVIGLFGLGINLLVFPPIQNGLAVAAILGLSLLLTGVFYLLSFTHKLTPSLKGFARTLTPVNLGILFGHFLDASATFVSLAFFGYVEQHVLPRALFGFFGPISFFALKIIVVIPVLYAIDRYADEGNFRTFLKIAVFILGFAPGLRDLLRLAVGV